MIDSLSLDSQDREAIAIRAYQLWQRRGCPSGSAEQDWFEAEAQLRAERLARLEATRLFEPPAPVEPEVMLAASAVPEGTPADAPKRRRRALAAASATAKPVTGTRVVRKRPARPDA